MKFKGTEKQTFHLWPPLHHWWGGRDGQQGCGHLPEQREGSDPLPDLGKGRYGHCHHPTGDGAVTTSGGPMIGYFTAPLVK